MEQLRTLLPNDLPGALINAFIFPDHWMNRERAREFWIALASHRPPSELPWIRKEAQIFQETLKSLGKFRLLRKRGISPYSGQIQICLSSPQAGQLFVNVGLRNKEGEFANMIGWEIHGDLFLRDEIGETLIEDMLE